MIILYLSRLKKTVQGRKDYEKVHVFMVVLVHALALLDLCIIRRSTESHRCNGRRASMRTSSWLRTKLHGKVAKRLPRIVVAATANRVSSVAAATLKGDPGFFKKPDGSKADEAYIKSLGMTKAQVETN